MKNVLVIGLGNFGYSIARMLHSNARPVLGIDADETLVNLYKDDIGYVLCLDATQREQLESLQLDEYDTAIVGIGQDITGNILVSLHLRELGIQEIITRAITSDHAKILHKIGVDEIIYPEEDTAIKLANRLMMKNVAEYLPLGKDFSIVEITPPDSFIDKSLAELNITKRYSCQVIGIRLNPNIYPSEDESAYTKIAPRADDVIERGSKIIVLGKNQDIQKIDSAS